MPDDDTSEILHQADALIRRHRVFVATLRERDAAVSSTDSALPSVNGDDADSGLPLLTEIVSPDDVAALPPEEQSHGEAIQKELARWLDEELPAAILKITDSLADQLVKKLTDQAASELMPRLLACIQSPSVPAGTNDSR